MLNFCQFSIKGLDDLLLDWLVSGVSSLNVNPFVGLVLREIRGGIEMAVDFLCWWCHHTDEQQRYKEQG